jgi:hypothetical protein
MESPSNPHDFNPVQARQAPQPKPAGYSKRKLGSPSRMMRPADRSRRQPNRDKAREAQTNPTPQHPQSGAAALRRTNSAVTADHPKPVTGYRTLHWRSSAAAASRSSLSVASKFALCYPFATIGPGPKPTSRANKVSTP